VTIGSKCFQSGDRSFDWFALLLGMPLRTSKPRPLTVTFQSQAQIANFGDKLFYGSGLEAIDVPASVQAIGRACFASCKLLMSVTFGQPCQVQQLAAEAFSYSKLPSIVIPQTVREIGESCFEGSALQTVTFQSDSCLIILHKRAFASCQITSICIPRRVEYIEHECFRGCARLASLTYEPWSRLRRMEPQAICDTAITSFPIAPYGAYVAPSNICHVTHEPSPHQVQRNSRRW
jgi:hypothetical protein